MLIKKTEEHIVEIEEISNIKCDMCKKKLLTKANRNVKFATVSFCEAQVEIEINVLNEELSQYCQTCYLKIKEFIKSNDGTIPSSYLDYREATSLD